MNMVLIFWVHSPVFNYYLLFSDTVNSTRHGIMMLMYLGE
jgi:hypothetical protein